MTQALVAARGCAKNSIVSLSTNYYILMIDVYSEQETFMSTTDVTIVNSSGIMARLIKLRVFKVINFFLDSLDFGGAALHVVGQLPALSEPFWSSLA